MLIEVMIYDTLVAILGNPLNIGIFIFVIFMTIGILMRLGPDAMFTIMIPVFFVVAVFVPQLRLIFGIGIGIMVGLAILKIIRG